ncbi:MAG: hypothetical protein Tsb009_02290 [Planctomycetaceae bacterium]
MADGDDLLDPNEIEALLNANKESASEPAEATESTSSSSADEANTQTESDVLGADDIEALLQSQGKGSTESPDPTPDAVLEQAEANLAAAVQPDLGGTVPSEFGQPEPFRFQPLDSTTPVTGVNDASWSALKDVELDLRIELGRTELLIDEVLKLQQGAVVPLDKLAGDPVDILVNGQLIARGEVLVLNENFCVRVAEILAPEH